MVLATACLVIHAGAVAGQSSTSPERRIALTFDDLPVTGTGTCDPKNIRNVTAMLTGVLEARSLPAAGFATPGGRCFTPALLAETLGRWKQIGAIVGNHSTTHPDFNSTPIDGYMADIARAQQMIEAAVGPHDRWFRAPLLHTGNDSRKKEALSRYLAANGYRVAPVTVDNQEWVYAAVYARARSRGDEEFVSRLTHAYLQHLEEAVGYYERLSVDVFGREIPQILLLHANRLNAEQLHQVVDMLSRRGYGFVSIPQALSDPAYTRKDAYVGPRGLSWLQRWALEDGVRVPLEPREHAWVSQAFEALQLGDGGTDRANFAEANSSHTDPRQQIARASRAFSDAYVSGDTAAIRLLYTEDAVVLPPERELRGSDAIVRYFAPVRRRVNIAHAMIAESVRVFDGVAVDVGTWRQISRSGDGPAQEASGRYMVVWQRAGDGSWRIAYDMWHRPASR